MFVCGLLSRILQGFMLNNLDTTLSKKVSLFSVVFHISVEGHKIFLSSLCPSYLACFPFLSCHILELSQLTTKCLKCKPIRSAYRSHCNFTSIFLPIFLLYFIMIHGLRDPGAKSNRTPFTIQQILQPSFGIYLNWSGFNWLSGQC